MQWRVPLADVNFDQAEEQAVLSVLRSGWLSMGSVTRAFEEDFAAFVGAKHALAVTNATAALHLSCLAAGLGPGDEVILPSLTFVATANAIRYTGATPVFAEIESLDWLTISPASIESRLTPRTRAIMVMHYAGFACDLPGILKIAEKHNLIILEDAAHSIGASLNNRQLGTWGAVGCYSFFANKNMTTAEGGMLTTDQDALAEKLRILRSHGMTTLSWDRHQGHAHGYDVVDLGYNYRIDEVRSAIGKVQLKKLPAGNQRRAAITSLYRSSLAALMPQVLMPFSSERGNSCFHILPILLPKGCDRLAVMESLKNQGIQTSNHYPAVHQFSIYQTGWESRKQPLPLTEEVSSRQLTLPLFPGMTDLQVDWVCQALHHALKEQGAA